MAKYKKDKDAENNVDIYDDDTDWEYGAAKPVSDLSDEIIVKEEVKSKVVKKQINYTISGLSDILKKEALKMLADGASVQEVALKYGVAPSDISIVR